MKTIAQTRTSDGSSDVTALALIYGRQAMAAAREIALAPADQ
jgi:hypothetical protein